MTLETGYQNEQKYINNKNEVPSSDLKRVGGGATKVTNSNSPGNSSSGSSGKSSSSSKSGNSDKGVSSKSNNQINRRGSGDVGRHGIVPISSHSSSQLPGSRGSVADPTRMPTTEVKMIAAVKHQPIIRSNEALLGAAPSPRKERVMVKSPSPLVGHGNGSSNINNNNLINDHRLRSSPPFAAKRCSSSNNPVLVTEKVSSTSNNNNVNGGIHLNKVSGTHRMKTTVTIVAWRRHSLSLRN